MGSCEIDSFVVVMYFVLLHLFPLMSSGNCIRLLLMTTGGRERERERVSERERERLIESAPEHVKGIVDTWKITLKELQFLIQIKIFFFF